MSTPKPPKSDDPIADFLDFGFFIPAQIGGIFGAGYGLYTGCTKYTDRVLFDQCEGTCGSPTRPPPLVVIEPASMMQVL